MKTKLMGVGEAVAPMAFVKEIIKAKKKKLYIIDKGTWN